jgi:hypothetical protein
MKSGAALKTSFKTMADSSVRIRFGRSVEARPFRAGFRSRSRSGSWNSSFLISVSALGYRRKFNSVLKPTQTQRITTRLHTSAWRSILAHFSGGNPNDFASEWQSTQSGQIIWPIAMNFTIVLHGVEGGVSATRSRRLGRFPFRFAQPDSAKPRAFRRRRFAEFCLPLLTQ